MRIAFTHNLQLSHAEEEAEFDTPATVGWVTDGLRALGHDVEPLEVSGPPSRVVARLETATGVRINPGELILQTLGQVAALCEQRAPSAPPPTAPAPRPGLLQSLLSKVRKRKGTVP